MVSIPHMVPTYGYNPYDRNIFISKSMSSLVVKRISLILVTHITKLFKEDITHLTPVLHGSIIL